MQAVQELEERRQDYTRCQEALRASASRADHRE
jgi:hypothetical protein